MLNCQHAILSDSHEQIVSHEILEKINKSYSISKEADIRISKNIKISNSVLCLETENELNKYTTECDEVFYPAVNFSKPENCGSHQGFEEYDSDDSLGILPHILEDKKCDNLILEIDSTKTHLNSCVNLSSNTEKWICAQNSSFHDNHNEFVFLSPSILPKYPFLSKIEENPMGSNVTPKFASTPKHEVSYTYVIDEKAIASTEIFLYDAESPISSYEKGKQFILDETEIVLNSGNVLLPDEVKNRTQNILNETCIIDPIDENLIPLNTLNCVVLEEYLNAATDNCSLVKKKGDILNVTCDILKPKELVNYTEDLDINCIPTNNLNVTISYSARDEENELANKKAEILNTTASYSDEAKCKTGILNTTVSYSDVVENKTVLNGKATISNTAILYSEKSYNIIENDSTEILNTISYSDGAKNKRVSNDKVEILNTTILCSEKSDGNITGNVNPKILNTTISYSTKSVDNIVKNVSNKILNTTISYPEKSHSIIENDSTEILNTTILYSEKSDCNITGNVNPKILNTTISYSTKSVDNIVENVGNKILNTTILYPEKSDSIIENANAEILNTTISCSTKSFDDIVENVSNKISTTYEKTEPCELELNVKRLKIMEPSFKSDENKIQVDAKRKGLKFNSFRMNSSHSKDGSSKIGSTFERNRQLRKSVGCFAKTNIVNEKYENKALRKSMSSSFHTASKAGESIVYSFDKNLHSKCPTKTVRKSFVKRDQFQKPNYNACKNTFNSSYIKTNFSENSNEIVTSSVSEDKLTDRQVFNETKLSAIPPDVTKTVVKKPLFSKQKYGCDVNKKTGLVSEVKDNKVFNENKNEVTFLPDKSKTVVKKTQSFKNFKCSTNSSEPCKKLLFKPQSKDGATANKNKALKIPTALKKEIQTHKTNKNFAIPCFKKPVCSTGNLDKNNQISRIPEKHVNPSSMDINSTNLKASHSFTPAKKMAIMQYNSKPSTSTVTTCILAPKSHFNNSRPIPEFQNKFKQTLPANKSFCEKEHNQQSERNSQNYDPNLPKKSCLNETMIFSSHKSSEGSQNCKFLPKPLSKIPCFSQKKQKAHTGVKSSLRIPRAVHEGKNHSQYSN